MLHFNIFSFLLFCFCCFSFQSVYGHINEKAWKNPIIFVNDPSINKTNLREKRQFIPQPLISPSLIPFGQLRDRRAFCFTPIMANIPPRCAFISTRTQTWYSAQQFCQRQFGGVGLFSVQSEAENEQLLSILGLFRQGLTILGAARSFWLGMICQCQQSPFSCFQCQWSDGHPVSAYSAPPTSITDNRIGPLWSRGFYNDHFWRSLDGKMCLFATDHWALYDCGFLDPNGGFVCEISYNLAIQLGATFG